MENGGIISGSPCVSISILLPIKSLHTPNGIGLNRSHKTITKGLDMLYECFVATDVSTASDSYSSWWRHPMETFSALMAICAGNSPVTGEFPAQRLVTRSFDVFFELGLNERLSKQSWGWWFETPSHPWWCHSDERLKWYYVNPPCRNRVICHIRVVQPRIDYMTPRKKSI